MSDTQAGYRQILRSSALIGGSTLVGVALSICRAKAMALLLGPAGFGLMGLYSSVSDLLRSVAEMGINSSGVRQIAAAAGSGDALRMARTATVLRRIALLLGLFGAVTMVLLSRVISELTFGDASHASALALLSLAVFFRLVADGQTALIQGLRRLRDLAKLGILGALFGTVVSVALVFLMGEDGIVPSLIAVAAMSIVTSAWYSRRVGIVVPALSMAEFRGEAGALLRLGLAFMSSALLATGAAYVVRLVIVHEVGLREAGLYQAAWTLGGLYVGFVLQAMAADFYPRLVGAAEDHPRCNRLVNEQALVSLLLAGPGVVGTLTLASVMVVVFYSTMFEGAVETLRWICLGMALRVVSWPLGYIIVAKAEQRLFMATEAAWAAAYMLLTWGLVQAFGFRGVGMAFFASYVLHLAVVYPIARRLTGFRWSGDNLRAAVLMLSASALVFGGFAVLSAPWATLLGLLVSLLMTIYSARTLIRLLPPGSVPPVLRRVLCMHEAGARVPATAASQGHG